MATVTFQGTERLSNSVYQSKVALLKGERQKKAKVRLNDIWINQDHIYSFIEITEGAGEKNNLRCVIIFYSALYRKT